MMKYRFILILGLVFCSFGVAAAAGAHQPRYITGDQLVVIKNPRVSQAFYGELKGQPAFYVIDLKEAQELYWQILVPALPNIGKDKTVAIEYAPELGQAAAVFATLNPEAAAWTAFYEEYAGDDYWQGPWVKKFGEAGYYFIKVSSPDNLGKYVLVVGEKEEFPILEMAKALITIPRLKTKFFNKPVWRSFEGKVGKYAGLGLLALIIFSYLFYKFHRVYK
ncbi:MAG: hypothetical protein PHS62_00230 [Patescibacteria group bacterium]|nr:hypothetical protein [Patescibacteria group bacterium]